MLEWQDYVSKLLSTKSSFDGITLSFSDSEKRFGVPPIIKSSILMLDQIIQHQGKFNIMVFPEKTQSIFIFTLVKLLHNISEGQIVSNYDPNAFVLGQKLRLGKAVFEFVRIEGEGKKKCMTLRFADLIDIAPIEIFPLFQKTNAQRLSNYKVFANERKHAKAMLSIPNSERKYIQLLADHKTHMESSIVNMTSLINTKTMMSICKLCGQNVKEAILVGQSDYEGNVKNIGAGQLGGIPAIVLATDLYSITAMAKREYPIQSILIDASNSNSILSQLSELDELMRIGVPITCVTDVVNSFDLNKFKERKFNIWRWDEASITENLYDARPLISDQKIKNCAKQKVDYLIANGKELSTAIKLLYENRKESQTSSAQMMRLFEKLFSLAFAALWEAVPIEEVQRLQYRASLDYCSVVLESEKIFLSEKTYEDYFQIVGCLKKVYAKEFVFPKIEMLANFLASTHPRMMALVVPERCDKNRIRVYWQNWVYQKAISVEIHTFYPAEYYSISCDEFDATIVIGWLKRAIMRKILYGFNTQFYIVLLYDYENRWKNYTMSKWTASLDCSQNRRIIEKSFISADLKISTKHFIQSEFKSEETPQDDEFAEIEMVLRENKYQQYVANGGQKAENETAEVIPVNYVGGYLAFYRTGHKVISASNIIEHDTDKIETKLPSELKIGDFVVVREADRDLVKEIADVILKRSGKTELRELATKWKDSLLIETLFNSPEEIYERLQKAGCTRGYQTIQSWLTDEDMIAPQSKQDLEHIAAVTGNGVLKEKLDQIYDAAQTVKTAHVQAGRVLSQQLKSRVVAALKEYGNIDPFNIWEPIEMQVDGVGPVQILKIIDISSPIVVNIADTNRLIDEQGDILWHL